MSGTDNVIRGTADAVAVRESGGATDEAMGAPLRDAVARLVEHQAGLLARINETLGERNAWSEERLLAFCAAVSSLLLHLAWEAVPPRSPPALVCIRGLATDWPQVPHLSVDASRGSPLFQRVSGSTMRGEGSQCMVMFSRDECVTWIAQHLGCSWEIARSSWCLVMPLLHLAPKGLHGVDLREDPSNATNLLASEILDSAADGTHDT